MLGSRLIDSTSTSLVNQFFTKFGNLMKAEGSASTSVPKAKAKTAAKTKVAAKKPIKKATTKTAAKETKKPAKKK